MDSALKQRLIGAAVLVALAMIFLPMVLKGPDTAQTDAARVSLDLPAAPDQEFETRELPLTLPVPNAPGERGVLGLDRGGAASDDPNAITTVDQTGEPAPRVEYEPGPEPEGPAIAVDAATGLPQPAAPVPTTTPTPTPTAPPAPVAVTPPPAAAPLPAATAGGRYAVNVGSFSNLDNARALADRIRSSGLPLTSEPVDVAGKPAMRLRVGPYGDRAAAEAARLRVQSVTGGESVVVTLDAAPEAAPARASTASAVGFAVQLGALSSEADASALRDRARAAGFVAFHQRVSTERGDVWRVRVGPEADRDAAERLRDSVIARLGLGDAIVVPHP